MEGVTEKGKISLISARYVPENAPLPPKFRYLHAGFTLFHPKTAPATPSRCSIRARKSCIHPRNRHLRRSIRRPQVALSGMATGHVHPPWQHLYKPAHQLENGANRKSDQYGLSPSPPRWNDTPAKPSTAPPTGPRDACPYLSAPSEPSISPSAPPLFSFRAPSLPIPPP